MEQKQSTVVMCDRRHCIPRRLSRGQVSVNVGDLGYVTEKEIIIWFGAGRHW